MIPRNNPDPRPQAGNPQALDLPLLPSWAVTPNVWFRCAKVGCRCHFHGHEMAPAIGWWKGVRWFAPCGHEQTTLRPRTLKREALP